MTEHDSQMTDAEKLELIGLWVENEALWPRIDGRRDALRRILAGQRVEPVYG